DGRAHAARAGHQHARAAEAAPLALDAAHEAGAVAHVAQQRAVGPLNRPLKKCSSNTLPPLVSKTRAISTRLPSDFECHCGLFSGHLAHFGRTYPTAHA